jgi:hypothetical protein
MKRQFIATREGRKILTFGMAIEDSLISTLSTVWYPGILRFKPGSSFTGSRPKLVCFYESREGTGNKGDEPQTPSFIALFDNRQERSTRYLASPRDGKEAGRVDEGARTGAGDVAIHVDEG